MTTDDIPGGLPIPNGAALAVNSDGTAWEGHTFTNDDDLSQVAFSGDYTDLANKPTIPAAQVNADWDATVGKAEILNKPTLGTAASADTGDFATAAQGTLADTAAQPADVTEAMMTATEFTQDQIAGLRDDLSEVAFSGDYGDLSNRPTIPTVPVQAVNGRTGYVTGLAEQSYVESADAALLSAINSKFDKPSGTTAQYLRGDGAPAPFPTIPKVFTASGTVSGGSVTFNLSSAGFTNLNQAGCQFRVNDDDEQYSYEVTSLSNTSVTISVKRRQFVGVVVLSITVLGSTAMVAASNGTTVYGTFVGQ